MFGKCFTKSIAASAMAVLLLIAGQSQAQQNSLTFPWNSGYRTSSQPSYVTPRFYTNVAPAQPANYSFYYAPAPEKNAANLARTTVKARVPANAKIWIEGEATTSTGESRTFSSPPLTPGVAYSYTIRVDWMEEGKQFSQTQEIPVKAGGVELFHLNQTDAMVGSNSKTADAK